MDIIALQYFVDPLCSWCYGFSPVISRLQREHGDRLHIDLILGGESVRQTEPLSETKRRWVLRFWDEVEKRTGQPFARPGAMVPGFVYDTEPASRAVVLMRTRQPQRALAYLGEIQHQFYAEGRDMTRLDALAGIVAGYGEDPDEFATTLDTEDACNQTQHDFWRTRNAPVEGFPTLLYEREGLRALRLAIGYTDYDVLCGRLQEHDLLPVTA